MKGILYKEEYGWVIRYKKPHAPFQFEVPLHSDSVLDYNTELVELQDGVVEFDIVLGINPYYGDGECEFAKLKKRDISWDDIGNLFSDTYSVDSQDSKLSFIPFLNWLKRNYNVPTQK